MRTIFVSTTILIMICGLIVSANAELIDRGGGMIYDTVQNITWLQNANFCGTGTNYLSDPACVLGGAFSGEGNPPLKGGMFWDGAQTWAQNLVYGGFDDWRLPTTDPLDETCSMPPGIGFNCQQSEMGHLYYVDGITLANPSLFINIPVSNWHWSNEYNTDLAWIFQFNNGWQGHFGKNWGTLGFAWAVRDGDVIPCITDADCNDGLFCNGVETCSNGYCVEGTNPCPGRKCDETQDKCVECQTVTFNFTGEVTDVFGNPFNLGLSVNDRVTGSFTYDTCLPQVWPPYPDSTYTRYMSPSPTSDCQMSVEIAEHTLQSQGLCSIEMSNNNPGDGIFPSYYTPFLVDEVLQNGSGFMDIGLYEPYSLGKFNSTALPFYLDIGFSFREGRVHDFDSGDGLNFSIDTLSFTPPNVRCSFDPVPREPIQLMRGAKLNYWAAVENNTAESHRFQFATRIKKPDGNWYPHWVLGPVTLTLDPGASKSRYLTLNIPLNAPLGTYTYYGYVGNDPPPVLYDRCQFSFTVVR